MGWHIRDAKASHDYCCDVEFAESQETQRSGSHQTYLQQQQQPHRIDRASLLAYLSHNKLYTDKPT